jgi:formamidopyrimidine-DNA glycosylase
MPELPDLQVFSGNLNKKLSGKKVQKLTIAKRKKTKPPATALKKAIINKEIAQVYREGKELRIAFKDSTILGLHLMLRGQLHLFKKKNEHKHSIIELLFTDDTGFAMADFMGAATPTLNPPPPESPDALSKEVTFSFLKKKLQTKAAIKNVLLDQDVMRGIGNAYADEILWDARISPFSISNKIPDTKIKVLAKSIKSVLRNAAKQIKATHPDIISGEIRDFLNIHNARNKKSPTGAPIQVKNANGRKTYFTAEQEHFK